MEALQQKVRQFFQQGPMTVPRAERWRLAPPQKEVVLEYQLDRLKLWVHTVTLSQEAFAATATAAQRALHRQQQALRRHLVPVDGHTANSNPNLSLSL